MKVFFTMCLLAAFFTFTPPAPGHGAELGEIIADEWAGYGIYLPPGWKPVSDKEKILEIAKDVAAFSYRNDGRDSMFANAQAAIFPDAPGNPAMVFYWMDYRMLGISKEALGELAKTPEDLVSTAANALQMAYRDVFPNSIMINSYLENDTFILNLRSVVDFNNEEETTRNQTIRMIFGKDAVVVVASLYTGPPNAEYDEEISKAIREMYVNPEKTLEKAVPPFEAGIVDYLSWAGILLVVLYLIGKGKLKRQQAARKR